MTIAVQPTALKIALWRSFLIYWKMNAVMHALIYIALRLEFNHSYAYALSQGAVCYFTVELPKWEGMFYWSAIGKQNVCFKYNNTRTWHYINVLIRYIFDI